MPVNQTRARLWYVSTKKYGGERLKFTTFYEALLEAKGINPGVRGSGNSRFD